MDRLPEGLLVLSRPRPPVGWFVAVGVLASFVLRGVVVAGIITALIVAFMHPPHPISILTLIALTIFLSLVELYRSAPQWFAWLVGRQPQSRDSD
ncbi:MAG TPA: hypothetical protein VK701_01370 [Solirubrobacteraceae bacterium]|nr:hypothetical protein [Solirubrobacteraceae bacterium]